MCVVINSHEVTMRRIHQKKRAVQLDSPTVSQGSSLWTQKSVLERENKTREKHRQMLDNRKANQMRSILFLQHSNEIKKRANGDSFSDFSPVNLTFVSSRVSEPSKMSQTMLRQQILCQKSEILL